jgi:Arc/MetJ family transcription regulator
MPPITGTHRSSSSPLYDAGMARSRVTLDIEDDYVERVMRRYRLRTKEEAVNLALRHLAGQPMTREEMLAMEGSCQDHEVPPDQPPRGLDR